MITLVELGPFRCLMARGVEHRDQGYNWRSTEVVIDTIGGMCLIFDVKMELLQLCGTLLMVTIL
jgi:hypothetical protein